MPKKGKKGGGKQAAMTEEERLVYMQQKARAEEEMAKRKEDMLTQFLKDKLQKEERNSTVNRHKLMQQWRAVLRQTRAVELRTDIEILIQTFERVLDRKDSVIKSLVCDMSEAEQQSALALRAHLQSMDRLLELQKGRLAALALEWDTGLEDLNTEYNVEREQILMLQKQETAYLEDVTFAMEQRYAEIDSEVRQDYQSTRDDIKNKLEGTMEELQKQLQQVLHNYSEATKDRRVAFESLRARDEHSAQEIDSQMRRLQKMQDSISALRFQLSSSQRECEVSVHGLRAAREEVTHKVQQLKAKFSLARAAERRQLANLTMHSSKTINKLQDIIGKGEKLLRLAEMCRKLETEQEKVLPFYTSSLSAEELSQERAHAMEEPSEELARAMLDYTILEKFWQRYNKVLLERLCLEQDKVALVQENQQLRVLLKQYLDGISVSDEILRQRNPLLIVSRQSLQASTTSDAQTHKRHTVIEAAHVVEHTL
ncbi:dynein regulatory complex subunit 2 [Electrophorus electricus]|uniref:dynein regulatory complex subunit 2 n=1 Tax=Electrophorus electricus TaxID=8005 RepID=UPI000F0A578E|nr:dynein regulatory complex subunit 2 [Electrophorus electricus]XP_026872543.1 dynein regulatory complex subunit 2 [Electrophorus electricus]